MITAVTKMRKRALLMNCYLVSALKALRSLEYVFLLCFVSVGIAKSHPLRLENQVFAWFVCVVDWVRENSEFLIDAINSYESVVFGIDGVYGLFFFKYNV